VLRNRCRPKRFVAGGPIQKVLVDFYRCSSAALFSERAMTAGKKRLWIICGLSGDNEMDNMVAEIKRTDYTLRHLIMTAEHAVEGIAIIDLNGILRFVNTAWAVMHGCESSNELVGKPISQFHTEEQMKADVFAFIEETKDRGQLEGPIEHARRDGTVFPTHTKMTAVKDEAGRTIGLIIFVTDVSASRQTEDTLKQQAAGLRAANEQLQRQISERKQRENQLQEYCEGIEQQIAELAVAVDKVAQFGESAPQLLCHKT
jgi:PAS domain S-box-containing protein